MSPIALIRQVYRFLNPRFQNLFLEYKVDLKPRYGHSQPPHPELYNLIDGHRSKYAELLQSALEYRESIISIQEKEFEIHPEKPTWNNGYLPGLDIIMLYTMITKYRPKRYLEIGSGHSTKVVYKAKKDHQLNTEIISIDPAPRTEIDKLSDTIIRKPIENINASLPDQLEPGDVLFIDNSHRILPNSDSMVFYMEILPRLKSGVIVHLHDIYLPYDYPQFMCDRFYSEQYGLACYLLANSEKYRPLLPNFFISEDKELSKLLAPIWNHQNLEGVERHGGSFWLQIH